MKSHHVELDSRYFCRGKGGEAEFKRYIAAPGRISNSFSKQEAIALDAIATQLLKGAYGPQPAAVREGIQSLARKAKTMVASLKAQASNTCEEIR